jgi:hypothetical protein
VQHAVQADTGHAPVQGSQTKVIYVEAPVGKVPNDTHRAITASVAGANRRPWAGRLAESLPILAFLPFVLERDRAAGPCCAPVTGSSQPGGGPVRRSSRTVTRIGNYLAQCGPLHRASAAGFNARKR